MLGGVAEAIRESAPHLSRDDLVEGGIWTLWLGHSYREWRSAVDAHREDLQMRETADKSCCLWIQSKKVIVKTCSLVSSFTGVVSWATRTSLIAIGSLMPYVSAVGYWASTVVNTSRLGEAFTSLSEDISNFIEVSNPEAKEIYSFRLMCDFVKVAFVTSLIGWSVLGGLHSLFGGAAAGELAFNFLYYGVVFFCAHFVLSILEPRNLRKKPSS